MNDMSAHRRQYCHLLLVEAFLCSYILTQIHRGFVLSLTAVRGVRRFGGRKRVGERRCRQGQGRGSLYESVLVADCM